MYWTTKLTAAALPLSPWKQRWRSLIGLKNNTSGISDGVKFLAPKVESISGLNNETSSIRDGVKSLEEKVESLIGLISRNSTFIPEAVSKPKGNLIIIYVYENFYSSQYKVHLFIFLFRVLFLYVCFFFMIPWKKGCMYVFTFFAARATENRCICPLDFLKRLNMLIFFFYLDFLDFWFQKLKKQIFAFKLIILILA